jgi:hypothetical protein
MKSGKKAGRCGKPCRKDGGIQSFCVMSQGAYGPQPGGADTEETVEIKDCIIQS